MRYLINIIYVFLFSQEHRYLGATVESGNCIFKVLYLFQSYLQFSYPLATHLHVYEKCYFPEDWTLFYVALKYSFPLAHQFDDVINSTVTQMANIVILFIFLKEIEINKSVFCASGFSSVQCSDPFCIFTLVIVIIQNVKCVRMTSCTNTDDAYYYYHEMLYNRYFSSIVFHCNRFGKR